MKRSEGGPKAVLPFECREFILGCFQIGRTVEWARAHFFVGRDFIGRLEQPGELDSAGDRRLLQTKMDLGKIQEAAGRVARSQGLEIFDVEWMIGKQRLLRVYIDRLPDSPGPDGPGVSHLDCQRVSEQLSVILDIEELVPGPAYILEVSSPGLDRKLMKPADYERFAGRLAKIWLNEPVGNQKFYQGRLAGYSDGIVRVAIQNGEVEVPYAGIKKANLVVEI